MTVVVDASAMYEALLGTPTGEAVTRRMLGEEVTVPDILDAEVGSSIRRALRSGRMSEADAEQRLVLLLEWPATRISTRFLIRNSRFYWPNVSVYDSLYLMVAAAGRGRVLTCDGRLARAPGLDVPVEDIRVR